MFALVLSSPVLVDIEHTDEILSGDSDLELHRASNQADSTIPCDSCNFQINSLKKPFNLAGNWLFTQNDNLINSDVNLDTSNWIVAKTPGSWSNLYPEQQNFQVGWYRAILNFDQSLIGEKANILINAYMSSFSVYIDGKQIHKRDGKDTNQKFYSVQPQPLSLNIDKSQYTLAIRVESIAMMGLHYTPLEIRAYKKADPYLIYMNYWAEDFRLVATHLALLIGLFFILIYFKTNYRFYLIAGLSGITIYPFGAFTLETFLDVFNQESLFVLHYSGILMAATFQLFLPQFFRTTLTKLNYVFITVALFLFLSLVFLSNNFNTQLFLITRYTLYIYTFAIATTTIGYIGYSLPKIERHKKKNVLFLLFGAIALLITVLHEILLEMDVYYSNSWWLGGLITQLAASFWVSSTMFTNTFVKNKVMMKDMKSLNINLENIVTERTNELKEKTENVQSILTNLPEGVMTISDNNIISPEYSAYLERILESKEIANTNLFDTLFAKSNLSRDVISAIHATLISSLNDDFMNYEFNSHNLPFEVLLTFENGIQKSVEIVWSPIINNDDVVEKIMLAIRDTTLLKETIKESNKQKRELQIIGQILSISQEKFFDFIQGSKEFIRLNGETLLNNRELNNDLINEMYRNMHTIKGNSRTFGLVHLTNRVHEAEEEFDIVRQNPKQSEISSEQLLKSLRQIMDIINEYEDININKLGRKTAGNRGRRGREEEFLIADKDAIKAARALLKYTNFNDANALSRDLQYVNNILSLVGTSPITDILDATLLSLPSLAKELGKLKPVVKIDDNNIYIKNHIKDMIKNSFVHVLRNSLDHGIESALTRKKSGKNDFGTISIGCHIDGEQFIITYKDDGQGLNIKKIKAKAINKQIIDPSEELSNQDIANLIFASGFSTAEKITDVSGRGIGMDAVRTFFEKENGSVRVRLLSEKSDMGFCECEFVFTLSKNSVVRAESIHS